MMFAKRLAELRQEKKLTQNELAELVNISRSALSLYELGKREPDFETVMKLANFFGVTTDYLIGRTDERGSSVINPSIGYKLKQLREEKGLSRLELSQYLNVSNSTIAKYETGNRHPDYETLVKIADFFGVSIDWLLGRAETRELREQPPAYTKEPEPKDDKDDVDKILDDTIIAASMEGEYGQKPSPELVALIKEIVKEVMDEKQNKK